MPDPYLRRPNHDEIDSHVLEAVRAGHTLRADIQDRVWRVWCRGQSQEARRVAVTRSLDRLVEAGKVTRERRGREQYYQVVETMQAPGAQNDPREDDPTEKRLSSRGLTV